MLARFKHLEQIPADSKQWRVNASNAANLAATLARQHDDALLFRTLATLRTDLDLFADVDALRWHGATAAYPDWAARLDSARTTLTQVRQTMRRIAAGREGLHEADY